MRFWKVEPSFRTNMALRGYSPPVFTRDGRMVASGNESGQVTVWDVATKQVVATLPAEPNPVAFTSDGKVLITASVPTALPVFPNRIAGLKFWDLASATPKSVVVFSPLKQPVTVVQLSPDGTMLATGNHEGNVILWDTKAGTVLDKLPTLSKRIYNLVFTGDSKMLGVGISGGMKIWNLKTRHVTFIPEANYLAIAFSLDGQTVATGVHNEVKLWHTATGEPLATIPGHREWIKWLAFSKDGRSLASAGEEIKVWNLATGREVASFLPNSDSQLVTFSPDGRTLLGGKVGEFYIWSTASENDQAR
jgi:WD40 repeat protein